MVSSLFSSLLLFTVGVLSGYAPVPAICPNGSLVRPASGLSDKEETYRVARKAVADVNLKAWLTKTNPGFGTDDLPTVALTSSGGGFRALLLGAGVIQGLDGRDSDVSTSGLFQGLTYQAGLSGGAWLLSSFAGNNYPTISDLRDNLWGQAFQDSLLDPEVLLAAEAYIKVVDDILLKDAAGFHTTLTDPWGRLLSYELLEGKDGGVHTTLSSITKLSNFTSHAAPFPVITSLGVKTWLGECLPGPNATTYEFSPYEFGSWDSDVSAFMKTKYLGTSMKHGKPVTTVCTEKYDNLGYILGTSSTLFNELCLSLPPPANSSTSLDNILEEIINHAHEVTTSDEYATYRNPFYEYVSSTATPNVANNVTAQKSLSLVDGGEALQNNPIFPFLQPARNISVIIVNDNSADTSNNFPNGSEILTTYVQSFNHNLTRMPFIPSVETFVSEGLNQRATFFGCNDTSKVTIVYIPNFNFTFASNVPTAQLAYPKNETAAMIANGVEMASQGGNECWGTCLGCALMMKTGQALPDECTSCFENYCYYGS
ncbi:Lysophospholipase 2 [Hyphodiscus hymeniophilus]|uniref:Lysophospholipase n=1 Tax=Hyphodiscus hymeniophilus TaxID=353542 RepID=A0A9P7AXW7_9HELO|nr:Lysophospholipase 2 [Hyphodiscus hymeniophilus]